MRVEKPFPEDDRMWALWANQNCRDFDLTLSIFLDREAEDNFVGVTGAEPTEKGCYQAIGLDDDTTICEYKLISGGSNFGMLFTGGFKPVFYALDWNLTTVWRPSLDDWW